MVWRNQNPQTYISCFSRNGLWKMWCIPQIANPVSSEQLIECLESSEGSRSNAAPDSSLFVWEQLLTYQKTDRDGWLVKHEMHRGLFIFPENKRSDNNREKHALSRNGVDQDTNVLSWAFLPFDFCPKRCCKKRKFSKATGNLRPKDSCDADCLAAMTHASSILQGTKQTYSTVIFYKNSSWLKMTKYDSRSLWTQ